MSCMHLIDQVSIPSIEDEASAITWESASMAGWQDGIVYRTGKSYGSIWGRQVHARMGACHWEI